jgi:hypothetical protein
MPVDLQVSQELVAQFGHLKRPIVIRSSTIQYVGDQPYMHLTKRGSAVRALLGITYAGKQGPNTTNIIEQLMELRNTARKELIKQKLMQPKDDMGLDDVVQQASKAKMKQAIADLPETINIVVPRIGQIDARTVNVKMGQGNSPLYISCDASTIEYMYSVCKNQIDNKEVTKKEKISGKRGIHKLKNGSFRIPYMSEGKKKLKTIAVTSKVDEQAAYEKANDFHAKHELIACDCDTVVDDDKE